MLTPYGEDYTYRRKVMINTKDDKIIAKKVTDYAKKKHDGQVRKYTNVPYVTHPICVATRIARIESSRIEDVCVALLHDVVEDCGVSGTDLLVDLIGMNIPYDMASTIVSGVLALSNTSKISSPTLSRELRKKLDRERISKIHDRWKRIKLADRTDNLNDMEGSKTSFLKIYIEESEKLLDECLRGVYTPLEVEFEHALKKAKTILKTR